MPDLGESRIAQEACRIVAEEGTQGLTRIALARQLGIPASESESLAPSDDVLLVLVTRTLFHRVEVPTSPSFHWRASLRDVLVQSCDIFHRHPGMAGFHASHPVETYPAELSDAVDGIMTSAGFRGESIRPVKTALYYSMLGGVLEQSQSNRYRSRTRGLGPQFTRTLDFALTSAETQLSEDRRRSPRPARQRSSRP